ncbi:MAG: cytochrome c oxidase subunit II [Proteobacteria bacterium]|nr:cytochrome c oxidase subunit II [Pseudomonadota bacterium]
MSVSKFLRQTSGAAVALAASASALANPVPWQLNLTRGVTSESHEIFALHMAALWVCVGIGVVVFGAMIIAMFRFRKSRGAVPATWSHNSKLEFVWTLMPVLILIGLATPATRILMNEYDTTGSQMTIKVTGYQWKWRYDYVDYLGKPVGDVGFMSKLAAASNRIRQLDSGLDPGSVSDHGFKDYLLSVDKPLVIPAGVKVRFVVTAGDVIHGFWVPPFGIKKDAIPGIVNDIWVQVDQPGIYRGQCYVLCGQDHGFMPIVVNVLPKAQFDSWLAAQEAQAKADKAARTAQAAGPANSAFAQH